MKKKVLCFAFAVILILLSVPTFADTHAQNEEIKSAVVKYFNFKHSVLSNPAAKMNVHSAIEKESPFLSSDYAEKFETVMEMTRMLKTSRDCDLSYKKYSVDCQFKKISISKANAFVKVFVVEKINYNIDPSITSESGTTHNINLVLQNDRWVICGDSYEMDGVGDAYDQLKQQHATKQDRRSLILSSYQELINKGISKSKSAGLYENDPNIVNEGTGTRSSHTYNPGQNSAPVKYAHDYCRKDNPPPWHTYTGDCTNFISIAINKIIPKDKTGSNKWYWDSRTDKTASWTSAQYFRQYIYKNNNSTSSNSGIYGKHDTAANCSYGDIVQYASKSNDTWTDGRPKTTHSSIVTKISNNELYVSMHSFGDEDSPYRCDFPVADMPYYADCIIYLNIVRYYD